MKFILKYGLETLCKKFCISSCRHAKFPNLVQLSSSHFSPSHEEIVQECTSLILDESNAFSVVAWTCKKFYDIRKFLVMDENSVHFLEETTSVVSSRKCTEFSSITRNLNLNKRSVCHVTAYFFTSQANEWRSALEFNQSVRKAWWSSCHHVLLQWRMASSLFKYHHVTDHVLTVLKFLMQMNQ